VDRRLHRRIKQIREIASSTSIKKGLTPLLVKRHKESPKT